MIHTSKVLIGILAAAMMITFSVNNSVSQVTDIDGNVYKSVAIGSQEWTAENLNVEHYRNGDIIPQVQDSNEWKNLTTGAWCYFENNTDFGKTYSKLYNWYAINDSRGLAPEGWHVPGDAEWNTLTAFLGGDKVAGGKLKTTTLWNVPNTDASNSSGFSSLPAGVRTNTGSFAFFGIAAYFWSSSAFNKEQALVYFMYSFNTNVNLSHGSKALGLPCRCIKD